MPIDRRKKPADAPARGAYHCELGERSTQYQLGVQKTWKSRLALAIPAVLLANIFYVLVVRFGLARLAALRPWLLWPSYFVIILALIDVILVVTLGAVAARTRIGPAFWSSHLIVVLFAAPALANVLMMARKGMWFRRWYATVAVCCVFGVFLVFFQLGVGDALYGPDGVGGPFSP
jgi:hypothetical protein